MDFDADTSEVHPLPPGGIGQDPEWSHYPQSLFGNWTHDQVQRCSILKMTHDEPCSVHMVDVFKDGTFERSTQDRTVDVETPRLYWNHLETPVSSGHVSRWDALTGPHQQPCSNIRVRALFVENMTVPVLQILGTR